MKSVVRKNYFIILCALITCIAGLLFVLSGCNDNSFKNDEDYVEVTELRIKNADIKLASNGEPSTQQLNIEVLPQNATNKKLVYYIPSEYHDYVSVSSSGLLTAHKVSNGISIPLTVTSTTNSKAMLTLSILIEDVAVEKIFFNQEKLSLLYRGDEATVSIGYYPAHAIDGRNVTYTVLNKDIAAVSTTGVVSPLKAGNTTIKAVATTRSSKQITAFLEVVVSYAKGDYQLSVSGNANYNQVIGSYTPINFTLLILGENVDPEPEIEWYVGSQRIPEISDSTQFTHIPNATTQMYYYVYAKVTAYGQPQRVLQSNRITIYKPFSGITLSYGNLSTIYGKSYLYGDEVTFALQTGDSSSTVAAYKWYLSKINGSSERIYVGQTLPSNKNLTRRINVIGDYTLTAEAVDAQGHLVNSVPFNFSAEKFVTGDVLIAQPQLLNDGLTPDSYHWYVVECDENGNYDINNKQLCRDTGINETFHMPLSKGYYKLLVTASIGGVEATVAEAPYMYESEFLRVFGTTERDVAHQEDLVDITNDANNRFLVDYTCNVKDVSIEGIYINEEYKVFLQWNNTSNVDSYCVELTLQNGDIIILDSASTKYAKFGSNYCYINNEIVTLADEFSVRIKQKGSIFSNKYYYGTVNENGEADETHIPKYDKTLYGYFNSIAYNNTVTPYTSSNASLMAAPVMNSYIGSMRDMKELVTFIILYAPTNNSVITKGSFAENNVLYDTFALDLYMGFEFSDELAEKYPINISTEKLAELIDKEYIDLYRALVGAASSTSYSNEYRLRFDGQDNKYTVTIMLPSNRAKHLTSTTEVSTATTSESVYYSSSAQGDISQTFLIDKKDAVYVYTSDELVFATEQGYRPIPTGTDSGKLSTLYKNIKTIVASITDNSMTDTEKVLAFYDYLTINTVYDSVRANNKDKLSPTDIYNYTSSHLEGVFDYHLALCSGIAKSLTVMCGIVGIPCVTVTGTVNDSPHAWNKVCVNNVWYTVDATFGIRQYKNTKIANHKFFMISDATYMERTYVPAESTEETTTPNVVMRGEYKPSLYDYDFFNSQKINGFDLLISNETDLTEIIYSLSKNGVYGIDLIFDTDVFEDVDTVNEFVTKITLNSGYEFNTIIVTNETNLQLMVLLTINKN